MDLLPAVTLEAAGALLVVTSFAALMGRHPSPRALLVAAAGCAAVGAGLLTAGAWPGAVLAWAVAAYLVVQWGRLERKARRRER